MRTIKMSKANINKSKCECSDPGCKHVKMLHNYYGLSSQCDKKADVQLFRSDMEDRAGVLFCDECASDAMESGVFNS